MMSDLIHKFSPYGRSVRLTEVHYTRLFNNYNKENFMIGYPIMYGDTLEEGNGFTSETLFTRISEYCSNEKTQENFCKGYKFGLLFFGIATLLVSSTPFLLRERVLYLLVVLLMGLVVVQTPGPVRQVRLVLLLVQQHQEV